MVTLHFPANLKFPDRVKTIFFQAAQYIGEICRYLLAQPPKATDSKHQVSLVFGNGLRPKIWKQFTDRFNIKRVGEFYGSTEGNANVSKYF